MHLYHVSCFFLLSSCLLCAIGLISHHYRENVLQNAGMVFGLYGFGSRFFDIWQRGDVPFDWFLVHTAVGLFAWGTFFKVYMQSRKIESFDFFDDHQMLWGRRSSDQVLVRTKDH